MSKGGIQTLLPPEKEKIFTSKAKDGQRNIDDSMIAWKSTHP